MRWTRFAALALAAVLVACTGCRQRAAAPTGPPAYSRRTPTPSTRFAFDLFRELRRQSPTENTFYSPCSIELSLRMLLNGATGRTRTAMAEALRLEEADLAGVNESSGQVLAGLTRPELGVELTIANGLWLTQEHRYDEHFAAANAQRYGAQLGTLDFRSPGAPAVMNEWLQRATRGRIEQMVQRIPGIAVMYLLNATYFDGKWADPFDEKETQPGRFTMLDGRTTDVAMMEQGGQYAFLARRDVQVISMPYTGGQTSMFILLPGPKADFHDFCDSLDAEKWEDWAGRLVEQRVPLILPRFSADRSADLKAGLTALGMGVAFQRGEAEFGALTSPPMSPLWLEEAEHRAMVRVTEKGTEAVAATKLMVAGGPGCAPMTVDRPFVCIIRDNQRGTILFMGAIVDPGPI